MWNIKNLFSFIFLLMLVSLVSANGIFVNESINITKTYNQDTQVTLTIQNQENFDFYNIQFEQSIIQINPLNLSSGQNATVTATIKADSDYEGFLTLRGYYITQIGSSNRTEQVNIDYNAGITPCNIDIIKGDSINWTNSVLDSIKIVNAKTNSDVQTLLRGDSYLMTFSYPEEFDYYAKRIGIQFTPTCRINIMDDQGLVHNSIYDSKINSTIKVSYPETDISMTFLGDIYTLNYTQQKTDLFNIKNTGNQIAKNIKLSGDWMTFSQNNFDLAVGESRNIEFTIKPQIFETNQTNKTYTLKLNATGNFPAKTSELYVKIPHAVITNPFTSGELDIEVIRNFFRYWCQANPQEELCIRTVGDSYFGSTTVEFSAETIKELLERQAQKESEQETFLKNQQELDILQQETNYNQTEELNAVKTELSDLEKNLKTLSTSIMFLIGVGIFVFFIFIIYKLSTSSGFQFGSVRRKMNLHKGERV